jgi:F-type H+-transporting ATPase subunit b
VSVDATFVALIALAIFIGLILYLKAPALIAKALDERSAAIAKELAEARKLREEAQALYAEYESKKARAETEAGEIIAHAREQAAMLTQEARAEHVQALERRRRQAVERIARAEQQAEADVRAAIAEAAIAAAERKLREGLTPAAQADLVSKGVAELKEKFG